MLRSSPKQSYSLFVILHLIQRELNVPTVSSVAELARLVGEPARTAMLVELMGGRALTASELAFAGGVSPSTASGHLNPMVTAGLLKLRKQGRHRYFALASPSIATMLETIMGVAANNCATAPGRQIVTGPRNKALREARTCYNHLAGAVAVRIAEAMLASGSIDLWDEGAALTPRGVDFLKELDVDLGGAPRRQRDAGPIYCKPCLDWSERRMHIGGTVGAALYQTMLARHWLRARHDSRAVDFTPGGRVALRTHFGISEPFTAAPEGSPDGA